VITAEDMIAKRPGEAILANRYDEVIGKTLTAALAADDPFQFGNLN